ncbi:MAG: hypothetical protein KGS72_08920 [Cyanobacteria bacterium REEB67]|nr:hypothetical protein [Cyanobacteria bacterium REEB67]
METESFSTAAASSVPPSRRRFLQASMVGVVSAFMPATLISLLSAPAAAARTNRRNLLPPIPKFAENPYAQSALVRLKALIESEEGGTFPGFSRHTSALDVGSAGNDVLELIRAYCYEESPLRGSADCLKAIVDRCDCIYAYAKKVSAEEDFAYLAQLSEILLLLTELMPGLVSKVRLDAWTAALESVLEATAAKHVQHIVLADTPGAWAMADVRIIAALAYGGMVLPRSRYKSLGLSGLRLMDKVLESDGGVNYSDEQNDCFAYHPVYVTTLARLWQVSGEKMASDLITATEWYIPISTAARGAGEYYTAPSWKQLWDTTNGADASVIVFGITGSAFNAGHLAKFPPPPSLFLASFYRDDVQAENFPEQYIFYDQNIKGPRGRNGDFAFAATGRTTPNSNRGKNTYVGCMVVAPPAPAPPPVVSRQSAAESTVEDRQNTLYIVGGHLPAASAHADSKTDWADGFLIDAALAGVGIEVTTSPRVDYMRVVPDDLLNLTQRETLATTTLEKAAALSAHHRLAAYRHTASDWFVSQAWLFTPQRLVGLLDVHALSDQIACDIKGVLRFVSGCADWGVPRKFLSVGDTEKSAAYSYGALTARIVEHDFAGISVAYTNTYNDTSRKAGRLVLSTQSAGTKRYPIGSGHFFVVEIHPTAFAPAGKINRITDVAGVIGLEVEEAGGQSYQLLVNDTSGAIDLGPRFREAQGALVHDSGECYRLPQLPPIVSKAARPLGKLAELASLANLMDVDGRDQRGNLADEEKNRDPYLLKPYRHKVILK